MCQHFLNIIRRHDTENLAACIAAGVATAGLASWAIRTGIDTVAMTIERGGCSIS